MADMVEFEMLQWANQLPAERRAEAHMFYFRSRKDSGVAIGLSLLVFLGFGGIGRMYAGDVAIGVAMLFLGWLTCGIWPIIDLFFIGNAVEQHNRMVLMRIRSTYGA